MQHYVLTYHYVKDYMARRDAYRAQHLQRVQDAVRDGLILGVGVMPKEPSALLIFYADNADQVRAFAQGDPYFAAGLITSFDVDEWIVAGGVAQLVHPEQA